MGRQLFVEARQTRPLGDLHGLGEAGTGSEQGCTGQEHFEGFHDRHLIVCDLLAMGSTEIARMIRRALMMLSRVMTLPRRQPAGLLS